MKIGTRKLILKSEKSVEISATTSEKKGTKRTGHSQDIFVDKRRVSRE